LDWNLWLGPEADRPYHPNYTNMVFRGWYDFGGGTFADMGHYSLWTVFNALQMEGPTSIEPLMSHQCAIKDVVSTTIRNDFSFPTASIVRFRYPARGQRGPVDLYWYDGGMKPMTPPEIEEDNQELPNEAVLFVGDKGKILTGFNIQTPRLIPARRMQGQAAPAQPARQRQQQGQVQISAGIRQWIAACRGGQQGPGAFVNAWPISEAANLWAVALRAGRKIVYDPATMTITNNTAANKYLSRDYRKGFEPDTV
jgi:hypothetical protein